MRRVLPLVVVGALLLPVYAGEDFKSGLPSGSALPGPVAPWNINGKAKGRPHSPTIGFALDPVVAVFVREGAEAGDPILAEFLKKLDEACEKQQDNFLHGFVVLITEDAKSSRTEKKIENPDLKGLPESLVKEAVTREKLTARLTDMAMPLKHVIVGMQPDAPAGYQINDKPGVTVLVSAKHKVEMNFAFADKMKAGDGDRILKSVDEFLKKRKKKDEPAK